MDQMYEDKLDGKIEEDFWSRKMDERMADSGASLGECSEWSESTRPRESTSDRAPNFRTREQGAFSLPYAKPCGTRSTAENGTFELRDRRRNSYAHLQKAI